MCWLARAISSVHGSYRHIGVDLHKRETQLCIGQADGSITPSVGGEPPLCVLRHGAGTMLAQGEPYGCGWGRR